MLPRRRRAALRGSCGCRFSAVAGLCRAVCSSAASACSPPMSASWRRRAIRRRADAIIVLTGGQSRLDAALDLLKSGKGKRLLISGVHPDADRDDLQRGDRRRQAAVLLLRRHRPCRARHDRQCRGERQMGARATPMAASSWSPTTTTCRAACWKWAGCSATPSWSPIRWSTRGSTRALAAAGSAARAVHRIQQISAGAGARRRSAGGRRQTASAWSARPPRRTERASPRRDSALTFPFCAGWCNQRMVTAGPASMLDPPLAGVQRRLLRQPDRPDDRLVALLFPVAAPPRLVRAEILGAVQPLADGEDRRHAAARSPAWKTCRRARSSWRRSTSPSGTRSPSSRICATRSTS